MQVKKKTKKCKSCLQPFSPVRPLQICCSMNCAINHNEVKKRKQAKFDLMKARRDLKTRADHLRDTQAVFNRFIRLRDAGKPCISCQKPMLKKINAGHYLTVGAHPELRFNEHNNNAQCEHCNSFLSGNIARYRINLIAKIGREAVEALEGYHKPVKYTVEQILEIKALYRLKIKELERLAA